MRTSRLPNRRENQREPIDMRPRAICNAPVILTALALASAAQAETGRLELLGIAVTPHVVADSMRYRRDPEPAVGARVQMFLHYEGAADADPLVMDEAFRALFNGKAPA